MKKFAVPKEHGAYVVLFTAWLFGIIYSPCVDIPGFVFALILPLSVFLLQEPLRSLIRRKGSRKIPFDLLSLLLSIVGVISGVLLLLHSPAIIYLAIPLLLIALAYFYFIYRRSAATLLSLLGFAGLALITPLTILSSNCPIPFRHLAAVWLFAALFFCGSVLCVNIRLSAGAGITGAMIYHLLALAVIIALSSFDLLPHSAIAVITLSLARLLVIILYRRQYVRLRIKVIGIQESVLAALAVLISAIFF